MIHDSHDWGRDTQICCDLLRSQNGTIGSLSPYHHTPNHRQSVPIFFSNPDFLWSNDFAVPRFGQGGFRKCLERVYEEVTGRELEEVKQFGKPFKETYAFAERRLEELAKSYGGSLCNFSGNVRGTVSGNINGNASAGAGSNDMAVTRKTVFAVGDNIASDITGANHWGWRSILVRTGVFKDGPGNSTTDNTNANPFALRPDHHIPPDFLKLPTFNESLLEPTVLCDDIGEAVEHIIRHESLA